MESIEKTNRAAEKVVRAYGDSAQVIVDHAVGLQERNARFFQGTFEEWSREIRQQAEANRALTWELVEHAEKQRDVFQTLVGESVDAYMDFLYAPLSYYKEGLRLVENGTVEASEFPIPNYDNLNVAEITRQLDALSADQIREVRDYEKRHKNRETLIEQFDRKLKPSA